jgi:hypothetical protein
LSSVMFKDKWLSTPEPHDARSSYPPLAGALRCATRREARAVPGCTEPCHPTLREDAPSGMRWIDEIEFDGYRHASAPAKRSSRGRFRFHLLHDCRPKPGRRAIRRPPVRLQMIEAIAVRINRRRLLAAAAFIAAIHKRALADPSVEAPMQHIVLLGDSVFDNAAYVAGGPDVIEQLRKRLPAGWRATLRAVGGSVTDSIERQLDQLPAEGSHLVISVGGNNALGQAGVLDESARSMADALDRLAFIRDQFAQDYGAMLDGVLGRGLPTAVCTIYDPRFPDPRRRRLAATGLTVFNDCITREAFARGLPLIDLRLICDRDEDFANPIEPSVRGGAKIAASIAALTAEHDFARHRSEVFAW